MIVAKELPRMFKRMAEYHVDSDTIVSPCHSSRRTRIGLELGFHATSDSLFIIPSLVCDPSFSESNPQLL